MGLLLPAAILLSLVAGGKLATKKGEKIIAVAISSSASTYPFPSSHFLPSSLPPFLVPLPTAGSHHPSPPHCSSHLSFHTALLLLYLLIRPLPILLIYLLSRFLPPLPVQYDHLLHPCPDKKQFLTQGRLVVLSPNDRRPFLPICRPTSFTPPHCTVYVKLQDSNSMPGTVS